MKQMFGHVNLARLIGLFMIGVVALTAACLVGVVALQMQGAAASDTLKYQNSALRVAADIVHRQFPGTAIDWTQGGDVDKVVMDTVPAFSDNVMIDEVARVAGQDATIFAYDRSADDFVRVTTSLVKPDGSRAVGTKLGKDSKAFGPVKAGQTYLGKADILGVPFYTIYKPIFGHGGDVTGILFSGVKASVIQAEANAMMTKLLVMAAVLMVSLAVAAMILTRLLMRPLQRLEQVVGEIARGDNAVIPFVADRNEIGRMARALEIFRVQGQERQQLADHKAQEDRRTLERQAQVDALIASFRTDMQGVLQGVNTTMGDILAMADDLSRLSATTAKSAVGAGTAAVDASTNVQSVASAAEELTASIGEITDQVGRANEVVGVAARITVDTNTKVESLAASASKIGEVVSLIQAIAAQTNLLALNATIEAARAGDAGKGFAVVAHEVKGLAEQTSSATSDIRARIAEVRQAADQTTQEIAAIAEVIVQMQGISENTSESVRQQVQATQEITQSLSSALQGAGHASSTIEELNQAAEEAGQVSSAVTEASSSLSKQADQMKTVVETFLRRAATL